MVDSEQPEDDSTIMVSASQLATYRDCPRKWAFDKLDKVPREENDAANEGSAIHDEVEAWYLHGTPPTRPTAKALLSHLPARETQGLLAEEPVQFVWPGAHGEPVLLRGFVDLMHMGSDGVVTIYDHKSTSQKKYIKTVDDLRYDPQVLAYGIGARLHASANGRPIPETVRMQWTYVVRENPKTKPPHSEPVVLEQTTADLEEGLRRWQGTVTDMVRATVESRTTPVGSRALKVLSNPEACFKYGKCPFRDLCPDYAGAAPAQKEVVPMSAELFAKLAAMSNATPPSAPPSDIEVTTAPIAAPEPKFEPPKMPLLDTLRAIESSQQSVVPPDAQPNVSQNDPPPPQVVQSAPKKRGRPAKIKTIAQAASGDPSAVSLPAITEVETAPFEVDEPVAVAGPVQTNPVVNAVLVGSLMGMIDVALENRDMRKVAAIAKFMVDMGLSE